MICTAFSEDAVSCSTSEVFSKVKDEELEELLEENLCRTQSELAEALGVARQTISKGQTQNFVKTAGN